MTYTIAPSLAEILKQKILKSRQDIMDNIINRVVESLITEMNTVTDNGGSFGYICVDNECHELNKFISYIKTKVKKIIRKKVWRNWWGVKPYNNSEYILQWIYNEISLKFKGIFIGKTIINSTTYITFNLCV